MLYINCMLLMEPIQRCISIYSHVEGLCYTEFAEAPAATSLPSKLYCIVNLRILGCHGNALVLLRNHGAAGLIKR